MDRRDDKSPQGETARILVEFLEVAITSVVSLKGLYPPGAFESRRYMTLVVQRARHPQLQDYIHSAVHGLLPFIQKGLVERVAVIFFSTDNIPMEKFIFKLTVNQSFGSKVEEADLKFSLRSFLIKLSVSESLTKVLPRDCRWEITAYFRSLPRASTSKDAELYLEHPSLSESKP
ncbi:HORMA domain-containing protein [Cephalotus follicularis]|uniref:HORMA domain-containing protein n=1 Tax=Cephalotus follicularis TaxID=3775 RepID=A0A1Q3B8D2_CEPFO|nr:HORMA domain-containing protein [Cephalotus follicularis]